MFEEDAEEKKAGMIGAAIIAGVGALAGILGTIGVQKGKKIYDDHKAEKEAKAQEAEK